MDKDLIVISDLHLSAGYDEKTEKYSRLEDFFFDEEFKSFLEYLQETNPYNNHLIIAGDLFDFLQIDGDKLKELYDEERNKNPKIKPYKKWTYEFEKITKRERKFGLSTEQDKSVWKMGQILKGHEVFFQALANFLSEENCLSIISGNHDIELYWKDVQDALTDGIVKYASSPKANPQQIKNRTKFYPWFYYDNDYATYIEHGNQYDPWNSFEYFLSPLFKPDPSKLWLPSGSLFVRYFFNKLEASNPFADNIKPFTKYMHWVWKEDLLQFLKHILRYLPTMINVFRKGLISGRTEAKKSEGKNEERIKESAKKFGLNEDAVIKIYTSLKAPPFSGRKLLNIFTYSTFALIVIAVVTSLCLRVAFYFHVPSTPLKTFWQKSLYPLILAIYPIIRWGWRKILRKKYLKIFLGKLREWITTHLKGRIGKWISKLLQVDILNDALLGIKERLNDVQIIVTGHTHDPDVKNLVSGNNTFQYFNTGTWTVILSEEDRIIREGKQFAFVWIKKENGEPKGKLLRWDQNLHKHIKLILFRENKELS